MSGSRALAFLTHAQAQVILLAEGMKGDCAALAKAMKDRKIAGAELDVVDPEPLSKDHLLWKMKNVIIIPHAAGVSEAKSESFDLEEFRSISKKALTEKFGFRSERLLRIS